jgi:hypothetical protein
VGPFDLSGPYRLPGGTEMEALATGFERLRSYEQGRLDTEILANRMTVTHTSSALGVVDPNRYGGLLVPMSAGEFRADYAGLLEAHDREHGKRGDAKLYEEVKQKKGGQGPGISNDAWAKRLDKAMGMPRGGSRFVGLPQDRHIQLGHGVVVAGGGSLKNLLAKTPPPPLKLHFKGP